MFAIQALLIYLVYNCYSAVFWQNEVSHKKANFSLLHQISLYIRANLWTKFHAFMRYRNYIILFQKTNNFRGKKTHLAMH